MAKVRRKIAIFYAIGIRVSSTRLDFQMDPSILLSVLRILYIYIFFYEAL